MDKGDYENFEMASYSIDACKDIIPTKLRKQSSVNEDTYRSTYQVVHPNDRPISAPGRVSENSLYTFRAGPGRNESNFVVGSNNSHLFGPLQDGFLTDKVSSPTRDEETFINSLRKYDNLAKRNTSIFNEYAQKTKVDFKKITNLNNKKVTSNGLKETKLKQSPKSSRPKAQIKIEIPTKDTPTAYLKNNMFQNCNLTDVKLMNEQNDLLMYDYLKSSSSPGCSRIKDEIMVYKCDVDKITCPVMRERYNQHKLLHHRNKIYNTDTGSQGPLVATKDMTAGPSTISICSTVSKLFNICCHCKKTKPCTCSIQDKIISISNELSKKINEWATTIPVYSYESEQDKLLRERSIYQLKINLSKIPSGSLFKTAAKNEIDNVLENLPMWLPSRKPEQVLLKNKLSDNLVTKIISICDQGSQNEIVNKQIESIVNQWARRIPIYPNESTQDERKRKDLLCCLKNTLQKQILNGVFHSLGKTEIEKYLNSIRMWHVKDKTKQQLIKHQITCSLFDQLDDLERKQNSRDCSVRSFNDVCRELVDTSSELLCNNDQINRQPDRIFDVIIEEWVAKIPVNANESDINKKRREEKIKKIKNILSSIPDGCDWESKTMKAVKKFLKSLPMWHPPEKSEQLEVLIENEVAHLLIDKVKNHFTNNSLKMPRKRWNSGVNDQLGRHVSSFDQSNDYGRVEFERVTIEENIAQKISCFLNKFICYSCTTPETKSCEKETVKELAKKIYSVQFCNDLHQNEKFCILKEEILQFLDSFEIGIDISKRELANQLTNNIQKELDTLFFSQHNKSNGNYKINEKAIDTEVRKWLKETSIDKKFTDDMICQLVIEISDWQNFVEEHIQMKNTEVKEHGLKYQILKFLSCGIDKRLLNCHLKDINNLVKRINGLCMSNVPLADKEFSSSVQTQSNMEITQNNMSALSADLEVLIETLLMNLCNDPCNEEINIAKKTELEKEIILRICALNQNPEIFNDDVLFETLLSEDMQDILDYFLPNEELKDIKPAIKTKIIELVKTSRRRIKDELSKHKYRKKLGDKISEIVLSNAFFSEKDSLEVFKQKIIEIFIRLSNEQDNTEKKKKITQQFIKEVDNFITTHPGCFDICDPDKFIFKLFTSLSSISVPNKLALKSLVNEMEFKDIINDWTNELPLQRNLKSEEQLLIHRSTLILAKRLHSLEIIGRNKSKTDYEKKLKAEICKWLQKMPLKAGTDINQHILKFESSYKCKIASIREKLNACACNIFNESRNSLSFNSTSLQLPSVLTREDRAHLQRIKERSSVSTQMSNKSDYAIESPCVTRNCSVSCQAKVSFDDKNHFCDISDIPFPIEPRTESVCVSPMSAQSLNEQSCMSQSSSDHCSSPACVSGCTTPKNICSTSTSPMFLCVTPAAPNNAPERKSKACTQRISNISIVKPISSRYILSQLKKNCCSCTNEYIYPYCRRFMNMSSKPREIEVRKKIVSKRCCKRPTRHTINGSSCSFLTKKYPRCCSGTRCPYPCNRYFP